MALRAVTDHPKFARLKVILRLNKSTALGYLEAMWHFTGRYTAQGNIGKYSDLDIEAWVEWDGEEGALMAAFIRSGWIDRNDEHRLVVHDWPEWADSFVHSELGKKTLTFWNGQWPRLPESMSGETRKRIRAEYVRRYGEKPSVSPDTCPDPSIIATPIYIEEVQTLVQIESGHSPDKVQTKPEPGTEPGTEPEKQVVVTGGVGGSDHHRDLDRVLDAFQIAVRAVPKFRDRKLDCNQAAQILNRVLVEAPSTQAVLDELGSFELANATKFAEGGETDPVCALAKWMDQKGSDWKIRVRVDGPIEAERGIDFDLIPHLDGFRKVFMGTVEDWDETVWRERQVAR